MFISKRSNGFYYIFYDQPNGKKTCISTKSKYKSDALKFLTQFKSILEERRQQKLIPISLKDYCTYFLNYSQHVHTLKTFKAYEQSLKLLQKYFGAINLCDLTHTKMVNYFDNRLMISTINMARKDLICYKSSFNKAVIDGYINSNPCKHIKQYKLPQKLPKFFTEQELQMILDKVKESDLRDLIQFAVRTGLRQMELLTFEWSQVNLRDRLIILDNTKVITKSKRIRTIPISTKALQILTSRHLNRKGDLVFNLNGRAISQTNITHKFKVYVREAEINPRLNFHSLRHTFASWLVQRGVNIYEVSKLLGHSSISVTEIFAHLRVDDLRNAIEQLK